MVAADPYWVISVAIALRLDVEESSRLYRETELGHPSQEVPPTHRSVPRVSTRTLNVCGLGRVMNYRRRI